MTAEGSFCEAVQASLLLGEELSDEQRGHLEQCPRCRSAGEFSRGLRGALGVGAKWAKGDVVLEQYEVLEELGRGGQGAVYKARDQETGLIVALKAVANDGRAVEEVRLAIGINHPNVCRIYYTKSAGPFRLIVMEYVRGGTLRERLARGPIPVSDALRIFRGICEGVRAAHDREVVHGDLKPGNVLLRDGLEPVVCDFGLATTSGAAPRGGTEGYEAPEQPRGERVGPRSDVYALGVILQKLVPEPSRALRRLISHACAEDPDRRIPTVSAVLAGLDRSQRRGFSVALVAAAAAVAVAVGLSWGRHQVEQTSPAASGATAPVAAIAVHEEHRDAAASPVSFAQPDAGVAFGASVPGGPAASAAQASAAQAPRTMVAARAAPRASASATATPPGAPAAVDHKPCCDALQDLAKKHPQPNVLNVTSALCGYAKVGYPEDLRWMVDNNLSCRGVPAPCDPVPVPAACR